MNKSSIKILNNSNYFDITQPKYKRVQRPFTEEYARKRQNEWFFRCVKEFDYTLAHGGSCWIPTLTYNNENLPHLHLSEFLSGLPIESTNPNSDLFIPIDDSWCIECFDQSHIQSFTKKLRVYLSRLGFETKGMKWIVCSEFGEKKHRPHYHMFLTLPCNPPYDVIIDCLRRSWIYGFVGCSREFGMKCISTYGVRYATKYVVKDLCYYNTKKFKNGMTIDQIIMHQDAYEAKELRKLLRPYMPNMYCSKGLGKCFLTDTLSKMNYDELLSFALGDKQFSLSLGRNASMDFDLPQYYINCLSYRVDKDLSSFYEKTVLRLTDFGRKLFFARSYRVCTKVLSRLQDMTLNQATYFDAVEEYKKVRSVNEDDLAFYIGHLRYLIPYDHNFAYDPDLLPSHMFNDRDFYLRNLYASNRANMYVADFLYRHGLVDLDWYMENSPFPLRPRMVSHSFSDFSLPSSLLSCKTCSELPQWKKYEDVAKAFDLYMDKVFDVKECKKRNARLLKASDQAKCYASNPKLILVYESKKDC